MKSLTECLIDKEGTKEKVWENMPGSNAEKEENIENVKDWTTYTSQQQRDELQRAKVGFFKLARMPNVLGAVDGTLIKILAPPRNEPSYVCRKGYHALNVQAVADTSLRCLHPTGGVMPFALPKSIKVIVACFKLHNKCIDDGVQNPDVEKTAEEAQNRHVMANLPLNPAGQQVRQRLVQRF
ncbi:uncharacterized protein LOC134274877 [Saccostrea cucullata]|uniref:uncharacterized protein LOC134274877 n=1 Tax=Saccostrea cuccullata TaxID=36930 RepID=UPI002ED624E7